MSGNCRYVKQKKQVSYDGGLNWSDTGDYRKGSFIDTDSPQCGYEVVYRWVNIDKTVDYYCQGTDKYYKQKKQVSYDGGTTYADVSPAEYRQGGIAERNSVDCGYVANNYFKFIALENGRFIFTNSPATMKYSTDSGATWFSIAKDVYTDIVTTGNEIWWKGDYRSGIMKFNSTGRFNVGGNIMSIFYDDDFEDKTEYKYGVYPRSLFAGCTGLTSAGNLVLSATASDCYSFMFKGCTSLTTAPQLPATTLYSGCYHNMFEGCTSLTSAPVLSATTLANGCYQYMFSGCTSLTTAPELPATTLSERCYAAMFLGCNSLTTAPVLPAATLVDSCYTAMFQDCSSLNYIKCLATDITARYCTLAWVADVSPTGTFVKDANTIWPQGGTSDIPSGWTVQNA